ncbi:styrene monooxygenase/indole monooxygenase family protein [Nocardia sp. R6R-6]|uniref:styrene monooxygenase/indole monooxygenase family protein n=1 Tax=Nocardia sp. R6R-6 TaxID=3459303 RepID=UPI00403DBEAA
MRSITIIGAGQAGLQLGIGLLDAGYEVRLVSNRTAEQIANGRVTSSQVIFGSGRAREKALGLDFWNDAPPMDGISVAVPDGQGGKAISWASRLDLPAQSIDQRVKMPRWMEEFTNRGGQLEIREATIDDLEEYARSSDLVVVAAGKGDIAKLFERDESRSAFDSPQRILSVAYLKGVQAPTPNPNSTFTYNIIPGVGEYFVPPALTTTGPCHIAVVSALPGGPMDVFKGVTDPQDHVERIQKLLSEFLPWEAERIRDAELTDELGVLAGGFTPAIRKPIGVLPSGATVLGLADVVVLNDPITGQGSNNASKSAASYLGSILEHGDRPFDDEFKTVAFNRFWDYAKYVTEWTNSFLVPPPPHVLQILGAAGGNPRVARRFVNGFDEPRDFYLWFTDPEASAAYLQEAAGSVGA